MAVRSVRHTLKEAMRDHQRELTEGLNDRARRALSQAGVNVSAPTMFVGKLLPGGLVQLVDSPNTVLLADLMLADAGEMEQVLAGGLLAGYSEQPDGALLPVLRYGFVIGAAEE